MSPGACVPTDVNIEPGERPVLVVLDRPVLGANRKLSRGEQVVLVSWYYPPEEWQPLVEWYGHTHDIF